MVRSLARAAARIEHRCGTQYAQDLGLAFELRIEKHEHGIALRLQHRILDVLGCAGLGELPGAAGAAFLEGGAVIDAEHAEGAAQPLELRTLPETRQSVAARVALAGELERSIGVTPAAEIVELRGAELISQ